MAGNLTRDFSGVNAKSRLSSNVMRAGTVDAERFSWGTNSDAPMRFLRTAKMGHSDNLLRHPVFPRTLSPKLSAPNHRIDFAHQSVKPKRAPLESRDSTQFDIRRSFEINFRQAHSVRLEVLSKTSLPNLCDGIGIPPTTAQLGRDLCRV
jgi:hypothetical protein